MRFLKTNKYLIFTACLTSIKPFLLTHHTKFSIRDKKLFVWTRHRQETTCLLTFVSPELINKINVR
jgi:hypothetical protein